MVTPKRRVLWCAIALFMAASRTAALAPPDRPYNILMVIPMTYHSHRSVFLPLADALAYRGHNVSHMYTLYSVLLISQSIIEDIGISLTPLLHLYNKQLFVHIQARISHAVQRTLVQFTSIVHYKFNLVQYFLKCSIYCKHCN